MIHSGRSQEAQPDSTGRTQRVARLVSITTAEFSAPARRPARSVLDNPRVRERFRIAIPHWREQLDLVLDDLRTLTLLAAGPVSASQRSGGARRDRAMPGVER